MLQASLCASSFAILKHQCNWIVRTNCFQVIGFYHISAFGQFWNFEEDITESLDLKFFFLYLPTFFSFIHCISCIRKLKQGLCIWFHLNLHLSRDFGTLKLCNNLCMIMCIQNEFLFPLAFFDLLSDLAICITEVTEHVTDYVVVSVTKLLISFFITDCHESP